MKYIKIGETLKMNINLKLLIASVLINTVSFNTPYCMEDNNNQQIETNNKIELQRKLSIDMSFEQLYNEFNYVANNGSPYSRLEPAEKFFRYLFG